MNPHPLVALLADSHPFHPGKFSRIDSTQIL
jgi:hypothetical protein